jgi:protein-S-isoprenylcysteine O-methyltransferase Ste14
VPVDAERILVPAAVGLAVLTGTVVPIVRSVRKGGSSGLTIHRRPSLAQRVVGSIVGALGASSTVWAVLLAVFGSERLGVAPRPVWVGVIGWIVFALGLSLIVAAQAHMGRAWRIGIDREPTSLVTDGLYAYVRNPIYTGMILIGAGIAMVTPAVWTVVGTLAYLLMIRWQTLFEERHLLALHGDAYRDYVARVGRFLPRSVR